jgi:hypothetical protein
VTQDSKLDGLFFDTSNIQLAGRNGWKAYIIGEITNLWLQTRYAKLLTDNWIEGPFHVTSMTLAAKNSEIPDMEWCLYALPPLVSHNLQEEFE